MTQSDEATPKEEWKIVKITPEYSFADTVKQRDAALAKVDSLRKVLEWPERLGMYCRYCGKFSSTQHCPECMERMRGMPILSAWHWNQQEALEALDQSPDVVK